MAFDLLEALARSRNQRSMIGKFVLRPEGYKVFVPFRLQKIEVEGLKSNRLGLRPKTEYLLRLCEAVLRQQSERNAVLSVADQSSLEYPSRSAAQDTKGLVAAYEFAFANLGDGPVTNKLLIATHRVLVTGTRHARSAGRIRRRQNWVGGRRGPHGAYGVPPPPYALRRALRSFEFFLSQDNPLPPLVQATLAFGQCELLHPFSNGNGRLGRLLFLLMLQSRGLSVARTLPLEAMLRRQRRQYLGQCRLLQYADNWSSWLNFIVQTLLDGLPSIDAIEKDTGA
jgi:Fic family protein